MGARKKIRCYDYVNHPYEEVKKRLKTEAMEIFRKATTSAAGRGQTVAAELHVNVVGLEFGKDIAITIVGLTDFARQPLMGPKLRINLEWEAADNTLFFPVMQGILSVYPLTSSETQLDFEGEYEVPLGLLGGVINAVIGQGIAEAAVLHFIRDVAAHLRNEL